METSQNEHYVIENYEFSDFTLKHPFRLIISGASGTGKSTFCFSIIKNIEKVISPNIKKVIYLYGEYQNIFKEFKDKVTFTDDIKFLDIHPSKNVLLIVDDLGVELKGNEDLVKLFEKWSHHRGISVIFILQNIFAAGKYFKDIRLNTTNYFLTPHLTDIGQMEIFGRQIEGPSNSKKFMEAYRLATKEKFSGLFIDLHPNSNTRDIFKYRYFKENNIMKPVFILDEKNIEIMK